MALDSAGYYSNSIQGAPGSGADVNLYDTHAAPKFNLGYKIDRADGNIYRYCHIGTATNAGNLVGPTQASGGATYNAVTVVAPASAVGVPQEYPILAGQVGSHYVEVTVAGIAANKYKGSYLITTRGTGVGDTYRIIGNTATDTPATGNLRIQLAEAIKVAFTVNTGTIISTSQFTDLTVSATTSTTVTGVLMSTTTALLPYAWVCTRGIQGCTEDATSTPVAGAMAGASRTTAGAYSTLVIGSSTSVLTTSFSAPFIGWIKVIANSSSRLGVLYLQCE